MISERPCRGGGSRRARDWEGDLILGLNASAIGTLVERTTRFTRLLHLPPMPGHRTGPRAKNGPALAGRGAEAVHGAIVAAITTLPAQLRRSLAWHQGAEMARHAGLRIEHDLPVYFCDSQSPWQRGTNENTNGLLRQYFPKGTDLALHGPAELDAVAAALNGRPRKSGAVRPGDHVLEAGAGSGYAAAVTGEIAERVHTIERHAALGETARGRLARPAATTSRCMSATAPSAGWTPHPMTRSSSQPGTVGAFGVNGSAKPGFLAAYPVSFSAKLSMPGPDALGIIRYAALTKQKIANPTRPTHTATTRT